MSGYLDPPDWDDIYEEPNAFEMAWEGLKQNLMNEVKEDLKKEVESLRKENAELQEFKQEKAKMLKEHQRAISDLVKAKELAVIEARQTRIDELLEPFSVPVYRAVSETVYQEKCDKCDDKRYIHFFSPGGVELTERCSQCGKPTLVYSAKKYENNNLVIMKRNNKIQVYFINDKDEYYEIYDVDKMDNSYMGRYEGEPYPEIRERRGLYSTWFEDKAQCEDYCNWLNERIVEKEKKC